VSTENLAMLAVGQIIALGVFALGVLVGCSLNRKDAKDGDNNEGTKNQTWWHTPISTGTQGSSGLGGQCRTGQKPKANTAERAPFGRGSVWQ
jgi:hypothetical protein